MAEDDEDDNGGDAEFVARARTWLHDHASLRAGEGDWSNGPRGEGADAEREFFDRCRQWQRTMHDGGWAGISWPVRFGGRGGTYWQQILFDQELARFDATAGFLASTIGMVGALLMQHGLDEQRQQFLPRLLRGDDAWCQLFSEPNAGSDLANVATRAEFDGDVFVVNGQKVWTSNAHLCDWGISLARTDADVGKHRGLTMFIVDMRSAGIDARPLRQITGHSHFNEVFLTDVRVPPAQVVGAAGGGWAAARTVLSSEATMIGTTTTSGDASALCELARELGRAVDPVTRQRLVDVWAEERLLGWMSDRVPRVDPYRHRHADRPVGAEGLLERSAQT